MSYFLLKSLNIEFFTLTLLQFIDWWILKELAPFGVSFIVLPDKFREDIVQIENKKTNSEKEDDLIEFPLDNEGSHS